MTVMRNGVISAAVGTCGEIEGSRTAQTDSRSLSRWSSPFRGYSIIHESLRIINDERTCPRIGFDPMLSASLLRTSITRFHLTDWTSISLCFF